MAPTAGFIGLGNMGAPMATNLAKAGIRVTAFDVSQARRALLAGVDGIATTGDLGDLAEADIVLLMLPNGTIVREVLIGENGLAARLKSGALVIDMSSSDPVHYADIAATLAQHGVTLMDAPVSGNVSGAQSGSLSIMAGGTTGQVARARPVLEAMGQRVFHTGALGTGQVMKALNNLLSAGGLIMAVEILIAAKASGLDPAQVTEILNVSTGRNNSTERKIVPFVLSGAYNSGFGLSLMAKDLRTASAILTRAGLDVPLSPHVVQAADEAARALGPTADHTEVARWLENLTGVQL